MFVALGSEYQTGEKAPLSGRYDWVRHTSTTVACRPTTAEQRIPLSLGETFPPCRSCRTGAVWRLVEKI
jgi:YjzC-like protein